MKFYKKLSGLVLATALVMGSTSTAFAATNSEVITALQGTPGVTSEQIAKAQTYLNSNQIDSAKLDVAKSKIDAVSALVKAKGVTNISQLSDADKLTVANDIKGAASAIGLNLVGTSLVDSNGNVVASFTSATSAMKTTGTDNGNLLAIGGVIIALGAAALAFRKKETN